MSTFTYKILGQANPTGNTITDVYTVPVGTSTVVSTISICNQDANAATFSVLVRQNGATANNRQYINYQTPVPGHDTVSITMGMTLGANDSISVNVSTATISVNIFGSEIV